MEVRMSLEEARAKARPYVPGLSLDSYDADNVGRPRVGEAPKVLEGTPSEAVRASGPGVRKVTGPPTTDRHGRRLPKPAIETEILLAEQEPMIREPAHKPSSPALGMARAQEKLLARLTHKVAAVAPSGAFRRRGRAPVGILLPNHKRGPTGMAMRKHKRWHDSWPTVGFFFNPDALLRKL